MDLFDLNDEQIEHSLQDCDALVQHYKNKIAECEAEIALLYRTKKDLLFLQRNMGFDSPLYTMKDDTLSKETLDRYRRLVKTLPEVFRNEKGNR